MYKTVNIVEELISSGKQFALDNDRSPYNMFMEATEEYCAQHHIVFGGANGVSMLLEEPITINSYHLELYIDDTFNHARALADKFYEIGKDHPHIPTNTIAVESKIKHRLFIIWINGRPLIKMYNLDKYRSIKLLALINPIEINGRFSENKVLCMSNEIQLMSIYQKLYNPYSTRDHVLYTELIAMENVLFDKMQKRITGGGKPIRLNRKDLSKIIEDVLEVVAGRSLIVGDYASDKCDASEVNHKRLQILYNDDVDTLGKIVTNIVRKHLGGEYNIVTIRYDLKIPTDAQLLKYTLYVDDRNKCQYSLMDVFNSLTYETIPYHEAKVCGEAVRIAGDFVLLRFKLIDIYAARLILGIGTSNPSFLENRIKQMQSHIKTIRHRVFDKIQQDPFTVFQLRDYDGVYIEENVVAKKMSSQYKNTFTRYYPYLKKQKQVN